MSTNSSICYRLAPEIAARFNRARVFSSPLSSLQPQTEEEDLYQGMIFLGCLLSAPELLLYDKNFLRACKATLGRVVNSL